MKEIKELKGYKDKQNISYEKLAHEIGVSYRTLFRWINRENQPSDMGLKMIRNFLETKKVK